MIREIIGIYLVIGAVVILPGDLRYYVRMIRSGFRESLVWTALRVALWPGVVYAGSVRPWWRRRR